MAEHRIVFTIGNVKADTDDELEDLLERFLVYAPDCGPVVGGGPKGPTTDVTLALDAPDGVEAVARASELVERALAGLSATYRVSSVELVDSVD